MIEGDFVDDIFYGGVVLSGCALYRLAWSLCHYSKSRTYIFPPVEL